MKLFRCQIADEWIVQDDDGRWVRFRNVAGGWDARQPAPAYLRPGDLREVPNWHAAATGWPHWKACT